VAVNLFHISEDPAIEQFEPRPPPQTSSAGTDPVVWAIDRDHLHNYLLPRDCPRVTFYAGPTSTRDDVERFFAHSSARFIVAIESGWLSVVVRQTLYKYELPGATFVRLDAGAGYYVSRQAVVPLGVEPIDNLLTALVAHDVELRIMPSLWKLRDAVVASTLQFSIIRMRNARGRDGG
jgi:hypothetical protein